MFFVASRGHHADIGGITPGSMPPHSKLLSEEGATFKSFLLVQQGRFCEQEVTAALMAPAAIPGSSGTRNLKDNISDLKAQIAANQKVLASNCMFNKLSFMWFFCLCVSISTINIFLWTQFSTVCYEIVYP